MSDTDKKKTLTLNKGGKLMMKPTEKLGLPSGNKSTSSRGKVVVVTKPGKHHRNEVGLSRPELDNRVQVLRQAEIDRQRNRPAFKSVVVEPSITETASASVEEAPVANKKMRNINELYAPALKQIKNPSKPPEAPKVIKKTRSEEEESAVQSTKKDQDRRMGKKLSIANIIDEEEGGKRRSLASIMRAREKAKRKSIGEVKGGEKIIREVLISDFITVQELANRMSEKAATVIKSLLNMGMVVTVNQTIDADTAELVISELGHKVKRVTETVREEALLSRKRKESKVGSVNRAPVVTIMGHVDHGKTSLLDALRHTDVAASEAGGITQHIGAYQIHLEDGKVITFLDTPGHEAFTAMRMRGASVTDIVVLVVAADDGIMPQTIEAINHAKAAKVAIIVAINKIDRPGSDVNKIKHELLVHGLISEDMGGEIIVVEVSAKEKINLDKLQEAILLQAEILDLKASSDTQAEGAVIEARIDKGRGVVATVLVQEGTLYLGDIIVAGTMWGKIRSLINDHGKYIDSAGPSMPVEVIGFEETPVAGDQFVVVSSEKTARELVSLRHDKEKQLNFSAAKPLSLEMMFKKAGQGGAKELPIIIKADVQGSIEAITSSLKKFPANEINIRILHVGVGGITESDVSLAAASKAIIIGFNVRANQHAKDMARINSVEIRYYSIIYNLLDEIKALMSGMLAPIIKQDTIGHAEVREVFTLSKYGKIAGSYVTDGNIKRNSYARIIRDGKVLYDCKLKALKRFKEDVKEVGTGFECGLSFENCEDIKVGDKIEIYELVHETRKL